MSARTVFVGLLRTDQRDIGCAEVFEALDLYVELVAAGGDPEAAYPGITVHLQGCGPCFEDYQGLLAAFET